MRKVIYLAKRGLGKGLQALIPEMVEEKGESLDIKIKDIHPNPYQPRKEFDQAKLLNWPYLLRNMGGSTYCCYSQKKGYQIVKRGKKMAAATMLGLENIPAIIKEYTEQELMEIA